MDPPIIEYMFDRTAFSGDEDLGTLSETELIDAARDWARAENASAARKLAVMAEIFVRRTGLPADERESWWLDPEAAVAAELAAALNITRSLALHQTHRGVALRDRLPRVAALFAAGLISDILVRAIVCRTDLICEESAMAAVDAELAEQITCWGALSITKTENAIDALVERHDPGALRRSRESAGSRDVQFGSPTDPPGIASLWARLYSSDAALIEKRVCDMAQTVCEQDPRSGAERRCDALTALATGSSLTCGCGTSDCQAANRAGPAKNAVVYVIAEPKSLQPANTSTPANPAFVFGAGILPTSLLGPLLDRARNRTVVHPGPAPAESRYTPSRALADFIRCRDLTCRFPGCDAPATDADIDHTVPYPTGPTHASNLKCLCRFHHLLKTFWTGSNGWRDRQLPDGTIVWTSPSGHTYTTRPGGAVLFPALRPPTPVLWNGDPPTLTGTDGRGTMMPRRRQTRAVNRARTIAAERRLNDDLVAEHNRPPPF